MNNIVYVSAFLAALKGVQAGLDVNSAQNIAVYWGKYKARVFCRYSKQAEHGLTKKYRPKLA